MRHSCCIIFQSLVTAAQYPSALYPDSKNCMEDTGENILQSKNGMFALKFSRFDNQTRYLVIAYIRLNETMVWAANRNKPIRGKPCLKLAHEAGDLILQDTDGSLAWSANVGQVNRLELLDSGNLILQNIKNVTIWASFDHPTDTIVQGGYLGSGKALVSSKSQTEFSEGPYMLKMEPGGVVFYASFPSPLPYGVWTYNPLGFESSSSLNFALHSACNNTGLLYGSKGESINLVQVLSVSAECMQETQGQALNPRQIAVGAQLGNDFFRFLRLDNDGNLRTYIQSETMLVSDSDMFSIYFMDVCKLPNICGSLGICSSGGTCSCQDDTIFNEFQPNVGCSLRKNPICGASNQFLELDGVDYFANDYMNPSSVSLDQCKNSCMLNCSCAAAFFWNNSGGCYHYQEIKSLKRVSDQSIKAFIKVGPGSFKEIHHHKDRKTNVLAIAVAGVCIVVIISALGFLAWRYKVKKKVAKPKTEEDAFLENLPGLPQRYTYKEMEEATEGFSRQLGVGGFSVVFEGQLADGTKVAVKKLGNADTGHLQFRAEVATLGSINHVNLVRLFGFCSDGTHRLLVYEYMSNGSLDRWLFQRRYDNNPLPHLDWRKRYKIIHDMAWGLAFLHDKSRDRILHLDVKPQNILLDENFGAKLADFGLAKLMDRAQSHAFTRVRGTPGYLAPEWLLHACATDKSDVYSFGMVLLEIISGRKNLDPSKEEEMEFFPSWAISMIQEGKIRNVVDPKLGDMADDEWEQVERVIKIAFYCIQEGAQARPSMNKVILMLEGHTKVEDPPLCVEFLMRTGARISALPSQCEEEGKSCSVATTSLSFYAR